MIPCPLCTVDNTDASKFCSECGAALKPEYDVTVTHGIARGAVDDSHSSASGISHHGRFLPGTKVANRYRIVSLVGKGGMGEVYRADDLKLGHTVALKFLPKDLADNPQRLEYFHSEVRLTRQISHPNVCRVYDIGEADGQQFLSMEYIDGEDLKVLLRRIGRLPKDKGVQIAQQLCAGLAAAHEKGVLHRDLKPANVMIDGRGQVRITDFGLAKLADDGADAEIAGTPAYMAPEQLSQGKATTHSDIYSLGLILYELFTGQMVYGGKSVPELRSAHEKSAPSQPSHVIDDMDPVVERAILRCLEKEPQDRPSSAVAVAASLPGGDPLAAALAAGETPSPAMIAAAGGSRRLSLAVGGSLFAVVCLMLAAIPFTEDWLKTFRFGLARDYEPAVLKKMGTDLIGSLGWSTDAADSAFGYEITDNAALEFWYRQSFKPLQPNLPNLWSSPSQWRVTPSNPSPYEPGMLSIKLDETGRLLEFIGVPEPGVLGESGSGEPSWDAIFDSVGLDIADFERATGAERGAVPVPPIYADTVALWRNRNAAARPLQVVMATQGGRLVQFQRLADGAADLPSPVQMGAPSANPRLAISVIVMVAFSAVLAFRNLRLGRTDTQGARRCALYFFAVHLTLWLVVAHHSGSFNTEVLFGTSYLLYSIAMSFRVWLIYVALEPYVRRRWPVVLIGWSRLLQGHIRDPLVGREMLIGCLFGIIWFATRLRHEFRFGYIHAEWLGGASAALANVLDAHQVGLLVGIVFLGILLLLQMTLRKTWLAALAFTVLTTVIFGYGQDDWSLWIVMFIVHASAVTVYLRFGLLSASTAVIVFFMLFAVPHTADFSAWYAAPSKLSLAVILLLAGYGFYTSTLASSTSPAQASPQ